MSLNNVEKIKSHLKNLLRMSIPPTHPSLTLDIPPSFFVFVLWTEPHFWLLICWSFIENIKIYLSLFTEFENTHLSLNACMFKIRNPSYFYIEFDIKMAILITLIKAVFCFTSFIYDNIHDCMKTKSCENVIKNRKTKIRIYLFI